MEDTIIFIHSENAYASGKRRRPRGPRPASSECRPRKTSSQADLPLPKDNLVDKAIAHYIKTNLSPTFRVPSLLQTVEEDVLLIYRARQTDPIIELALSVLSLVLYGRIHSHPEAIVQACLSYEQLLKQTVLALSSTPTPCYQHTETTLFVTFCMSRYEDAVHEPNKKSQKKSFTSASHHDGSLALLRTIRDRQSGETMEQLPNIVKSTRRCMIKSALLRSKDLPEWIHDGQIFGETEQFDVTYDRFAIRLVHLRHQLSLLRSGTSTQESAAALVEESYNLEKEFGEWSARYSASWSRPTPHEQNEVEILRDNSDQDEIKVQAAVCLKLHATDILIISTYLSLLHPTVSSSSDVTSPSSTRATARMHTIAMDFLSALNNLAGNKIHTTNVKSLIDEESGVLRWVVWPLSMILLAEEMDENDKLFLRDLMKEVGKISGFAVLEDVEQKGIEKMGVVAV